MLQNTNLILLPIAYNDGEPVSDEVFDRLTRSLAVKFGGFTLLPPAFGGWIDREGKFQPDKHRPVAVYVAAEREEELEDWVKAAGKELGQEVMLVMRNFCETKFIEVDAW